MVSLAPFCVIVTGSEQLPTKTVVVFWGRLSICDSIILVTPPGFKWLWAITICMRLLLSVKIGKQ